MVRRFSALFVSRVSCIGFRKQQVDRRIESQVDGPIRAAVELPESQIVGFVDARVGFPGTVYVDGTQNIAQLREIPEHRERVAGR